MKKLIIYFIEVFFIMFFVFFLLKKIKYFFKILTEMVMAIIQNILRKKFCAADMI